MELSAKERAELLHTVADRLSLILKERKTFPLADVEISQAFHGDILVTFIPSAVQMADPNRIPMETRYAARQVAHALNIAADAAHINGFLDIARVRTGAESMVQIDSDMLVGRRRRLNTFLDRLEQQQDHFPLRLRSTRGR